MTEAVIITAATLAGLVCIYAGYQLVRTRGNIDEAIERVPAWTRPVVVVALLLLGAVYLLARGAESRPGPRPPSRRDGRRDQRQAAKEARARLVEHNRRAEQAQERADAGAEASGEPPTNEKVDEAAERLSGAVERREL